MDIAGIGTYGTQRTTLETPFAEGRLSGGTDSGAAAGGDVVSIRAGASLPKSLFTSDDEYAAYQSVIAQGRSDPSQIVNAHDGLDADRVYRLVGLFD